MRVAVINTHPIQHFGPLWREIAKVNEVELKVFFCSDWGVKEFEDPGFGKVFKWDVDLLEGYSSEFLPLKRRPKTLGFWETDNPQVGDALARFGPDVLVLFGYSHLTDWRALFWARRNGVRVLAFGDSELRHARSLWRRMGKEFVVRTFFALIDGALPIGDCNAQYYRRYGIPNELMYWCAWPVDGQRFLSAVGNEQATRAKVREKLGIAAHEFVFASVGKYIPRKRHGDVARAWFALPEPLQQTSRVILLGEGPLRANLQQLAVKAEGRITLTGFVNQREIPSYYAACDVLVVASDIDAHPLVVTESLFFGLPIIASDRIGCIGPNDTVHVDENGLVYGCGDIDALKSAMERLMTNHELYASFSRRARDIARDQDAEAVARKFIRAFKEVAAAPRSRLLTRAHRAISI